MKKNKIKNLIQLIIFLSIIILPTFIWFVIKNTVSKTDFEMVYDFDIGEKRAKATFSNVITLDNVATEIDNYYNDHLPFRSFIITWKKSFESIIELPYKHIEDFIYGRNRVRGIMQASVVDGVVTHYMDQAVDIWTGHGLRPTDIDSYVVGVNYPIKYTANGKVIIGQSDWMFLASGNINYYNGTIQVPNENFENYIAPYKSIYDLCKYLNKEFVILVCPEKEEIYSEYMPTMTIVDEVEKPQKIKNYVASYSEINYIYPKEELIKAKSNYRTYLKYDSHWSEAGAYIVANIIKEKLGMETVPLREQKLEKVEETQRDMVFYGGADTNSYKDGFRYEIHYKPDIYANVVYTDESLVQNVLQFESNSTNDKKVLLLGDSYRVALAQFFSKDFAKYTAVAFTDLDNKIVKSAMEEADVIIIEAVERNENITLTEMLKKIYENLKPQ